MSLFASTLASAVSGVGVEWNVCARARIFRTMPSPWGVSRMVPIATRHTLRGHGMVGAITEHTRSISITVTGVMKISESRAHRSEDDSVSMRPSWNTLAGSRGPCSSCQGCRWVIHRRRNTMASVAFTDVWNRSYCVSLGSLVKAIQVDNIQKLGKWEARSCLVGESTNWEASAVA